MGAAAGEDTAEHLRPAVPSPSASWPPCTLGFPIPSGHRTLHEAAAPCPQTEHLLLSSLKNPSKSVLGPQRPLGTAPRAALRRAGTPKPANPIRTSSRAGPTPVYLFFSLSAVIVAVALADAERGGSCSLRRPWRAPRGPAGVKGPKCSQARELHAARWKFAGGWRGAGTGSGER